MNGEVGVAEGRKYLYAHALKPDCNCFLVARPIADYTMSLNDDIERLKARPKDYTWSELTSLMDALGFDVKNGKGSRRKFVRRETRGPILCIHEPHPSPCLKCYAVKDVIDFLHDNGLI